MKILIYDVDFRSSGITYPLQNALEQTGHKADMFDWRKYLYSYNSAAFLNRVKDRVLFDIVAYKINKDLKDVIRKGSYDLFLVVRGDHIYPETIGYAKKYIPKVVNWNSDDLFNKLNSTKYILASLDQFDIHFSPRKHLRDEYLSKGAKAFEVVDWYYRPELVLDPPTNDMTYATDICFIGSWSERRENILTPLYDFDFKICGWGWSKKLAMSNFPGWDINPPVAMREMTRIFAETKVNINILTIENRDRVNPRNFDIAVAGGFQLSERTDEILEVFKEDVDIACFGSPEELKSKAEFYLKNDNLRQKIALAGYNKIVNGNFSLVDRMKYIVNRIEI
jgi:spore maturation protein CgeB